MSATTAALSAAATVRRAVSDPLYRNSGYLVASTLVNSLGGFLFWQLCAHLLPASTVGIGTSLVSAAVLAATVALAGMNNAVIRYLSHWHDTEPTLYSAFTTVLVLAAVVGTTFAVVGAVAARSLHGLRHPAEAVLFVAFAVALSVNLLADNVFVALRSAGPVLSRTILVNVVRLGLPVALVGVGGFGVFSSYSLGAVAAAVAYVVVLRRRFGIRTRLRWSRARLAVMWRFSAATYLAVMLSSLPMLVMPVLVSQRLDPARAAYFFVAFMLSAVVAVVPQATTRSLFAEGAADRAGLARSLRRALLGTAAAQLPLMAVVLAGGDLVLGAFGPGYPSAYPLLALLCLATVFGATNQIGTTVLALSGRLRSLCALSAVFCTVVIGASWVGLSHGLTFVGVAWLAGEGACASMYIPIILRALRRPTAHASLTLTTSGREICTPL